MIGKKISHYKILEKIGEGGMGIVYKANDTRLLRDVVLKILPPHFSRDEKRLKRFIREAQAASALNHPNICIVHDVGTEKDVHYIVMEFVEGKTLRQILEEKKTLPENEVIEIGIQICDALTAAHAKGIIHRDLKPENIMVTNGGTVKVMDFGLAKLKDSEFESTHSDLSIDHLKNSLKTSLSTLQGTASYMAPEQINKKEVDERADIFSLGIVLYELLTGKNPFEGNSNIAIMKSILKVEPKPVSDFNLTISAETNNVILKSLSKNPEERFLNAIQVKDTLAKLQVRNEETKDFRFSNVKRAIISIMIFIMMIIFVLYNILSERKHTLSKNTWQFKSIGLDSEIERFPAFSPDGKKVVYTSTKIAEKSMQASLFIKDIETGIRKQILLPINNPDNDAVVIPDWSPNGQRIAFANSGIWIADTSGKNLKRLTTFGSYPKWSPDGNKIVFSKSYLNSKNNVIFLYDLIKDEWDQISPQNESQFMMPNWSPNGLWILCTVSVGLRSELWLINMKTRQAFPILKFDAWIQNPLWSAKHKSIYFGSDKSGFMDLWRVEINEQDGKLIGEPIQITTGYSSDYMDLLPVEDKMILSIRDLKHELWKLPFNLDSSNFMKHSKLISGNNLISDFDLSPDGLQIVMECGATNHQLRIMSIDENNEYILFKEQNAFAPSWSADGKWIAFDTGSGNDADIWRVSASGGKVEKVIESDGADWMPTYSSNGKFLCFVSNRAGSFDLLVKNLDSGKLSQITQSMGIVSRGNWSNSGDKIAYFQKYQNENKIGLRVFDFETGSDIEKAQINYDYDIMYSKIVWRSDDNTIFLNTNGKLVEVDLTTSDIKILIEKIGEREKLGQFEIYNNELFLVTIEDNYSLWLAEAMK